MINKELYRKCLTYDFETLFKKKGYAFFTNGIYNLNIIGIRSNNPSITNKFDDVLVVIYNTTMKKAFRKLFAITTEPGEYYMRKKLLSPLGTAILVPGQYRGCWKIGMHNGKYTALCQTKPVKVYRDGNKDDKYDMNPATINTGIFGINIHRASAAWKPENKNYNIDAYSAGCQVFESPIDFSSFINLCNKQKAYYGNSFTYTLLNEEELND